MLRPTDLIPDVIEFIARWLCYWALLGTSAGLAVAYFLADSFGVDQATFSWLFAAIGFMIGLRYDYQDFIEADHAASLAMIGYLSLALLLMACEVLLVLQYLPVVRGELA